MEWELSKENVQPMKSGRNVEVLNDALKTKAQGHACSNILENQRRQLLDDIEHYSGDDPLQPWIRCIKWLKDAYPAGGAQSELLKLLEGCTRKFQKYEMYRNDVRYLRIWVQYADCCKDPCDVFTFLEVNDIGQTHAMYYVAYATSMEIRRNFSKADEIYRIGLSRRAEPFGAMENMYKNFLRRMDRRGERKNREEQQFTVNTTTIDTENQFRAFGPTSHYPEVQHGRDRGRQKPMQPAYSRLNRPKNAKISIFVDPEFEASRNGTHDLYGEDPGPSSHQSSGWSNLPEEADKKKENIQHPTKWTEAKIKQKLPFSQDRHSGLDVYVDEEFSEKTPQKRQSNPVKAAAPPILKLRLEDMQSLKRTSPHLKGSFLDVSSAALDSAKRTSEFPGFSAGQEAAHLRKIYVQTIPGYDIHIINENGTEKCFEELRLEVWKDSHKGFLDLDPYTNSEIHVPFLESLADVQDSNNAVQLEDQNADGTSLSMSDSPTPSVVETQKEKTHITGDRSSCEGAFAQDDENKVGKNESLDQRVDASANVCASTGARLTTAREQVKGSQSLLCSSSDSFSMQGDETIAIKRFADEITVLGTDPRGDGICTGAHQGLVDPTINTKECLADILDMFNKPLESDNSRSKARVRRDSKKNSSKSGGFQIYVDEDLQKQRPLDSSEDENPVKVSSSNFGGAGPSHVSGFQVCDDERPVHSKASMTETSSSIDTSTKSQVRLSSFEVFQDEHFSVQPARPEQSQGTTRVSKSSVSRSKDYQIFLDDEFCDSKRVQCEKRVENPKPSPKKLEDPVSARSSFKIYEDEDISLDSSKRRQTETRVKKSSSRSSTCLDVFVDEEFHDLSLNACLSEEGNLEKHLQQKSTSPEDKENKLFTFEERASGSADLSSPVGAAKSSMVEERPPTSLAPVKVDPWDEDTLKYLLSRIQTSLSKYEGFFENNIKYCGPLPTSSVRASNGRTKMLELGSSTYRLNGCVGEGAFASVFEAEDVDDDFFDDPPKIALKFQKPGCPWEFYIYRQLDERISKDDRRYYGYVRKMHLYTDCSFMICDYGERGTLQDVVNAYLAVPQRMDEALCMFYTIEMLRMLEVLHSVGIIHGDIKPDNFLLRDQDDSLELEDWSPEHPGCWKSQGLCLIDWGRSIDVTLFPDGTMFHGDCKTDSFRCPEMLERRPWTFQVDTFGLCGVVHCLLHGSYMQVEKVKNAEGQSLYRPKAAIKRYWNVLWRELFDTLLNVNEFGDRSLLTRLRQSFERHLVENNQGRKLKGLISKQTIMMFTASRR